MLPLLAVIGGVSYLINSNADKKRQKDLEWFLNFQEAQEKQKKEEAEKFLNDLKKKVGLD
jgi:hypothetical protein